MLYVVAVLDLAVAGWLLWYARRRERRNRAGVTVVGVMLVLCAVALVVIHAAKPSPTQGKPPMPEVMPQLPLPRARCSTTP